MKSIISLIFLLGLTGVAAHAQEEQIVSSEDQMIIFVGFIIAVAAVFVYLARDMILRKKTSYDEQQQLGSKEDKEYEKYHSDWNDDYEDLGARTKKFKEKFRKLSDEGSLPDLYAIMDIKKDATQEQIKKQYRKLAKESHPDRSSEEDAKERMAEINQAYEILSDPEQREEYDRYFAR